jgi:hypothetical protein
MLSNSAIVSHSGSISGPGSRSMDVMDAKNQSPSPNALHYRPNASASDFSSLIHAYRLKHPKRKRESLDASDGRNEKPVSVTASSNADDTMTRDTINTNSMESCPPPHSSSSSSASTSSSFSDVASSSSSSPTHPIEARMHELNVAETLTSGHSNDLTAAAKTTAIITTSPKTLSSTSAIVHTSNDTGGISSLTSVTSNPRKNVRRVWCPEVKKVFNFDTVTNIGYWT